MVAEPSEKFTEPRYFLVDHAPDRFRCHVASGEAGAARHQDDVDVWIGDEPIECADEPLDVIRKNATRPYQVPCRPRPFEQRCPR